MRSKIILALSILAAVLALAAEEMGGIGLIVLNRKNDGEPLRTGNVVPGSPAEKAGIKPSWFIISVDGTNVVSLSFTQSLSVVRGEVGTTVKLGLADPTMSQTNEFTLKRGKLVFTRNKVEFVDPAVSR